MFCGVASQHLCPCEVVCICLWTITSWFTIYTYFSALWLQSENYRQIFIGELFAWKPCSRKWKTTRNSFKEQRFGFTFHIVGSWIWRWKIWLQWNNNCRWTNGWMLTLEYDYQWTSNSFPAVNKLSMISSHSFALKEFSSWYNIYPVRS